MTRFAFVAALTLALPGISTAAEITGRASVIDGDTIEINGTRIRFNGIDAPESKQLCQNASGKAYRCGQASAKALDAFLSQSRPTTCVPTGKSFDRLVGHCVRADGSDVNTWMVRNGYAIDWPKYSHGFYAEIQQEAQLAKAGIWSGSFQMPCIVRGSRCD